MAKDTKKTTAAEAPVNETPVDANVPADAHILKYGDYSVDANTLPPKAIAYLLQNGFSQSMTDAAAFTKEQKTVKTGVGDETRPMTEVEVAAMAKEKRDARYKAILAGEVGTRVGGPKLPQIDRVMQDVALERIKAAAAAKGIALPKGEALKALVTKLLAVKGDEIRVEAQARIDNAKNAAAGLDELFA